MIYLARHGQTEFNREGRIQGRQESRLTPLGERQAAAMGDLLHSLVDPHGWRIVSSPQGRAAATAGIIGARLGLPVALDPRLVEIGMGEWEGQLYAELAKTDPGLFATRDWFFQGPGGETYEGITARVRDVLGELAQESGRRVILVSHGMTGRIIRGVYAGLSRDDALAQDVPQDAIFRLHGGTIERLACEPVAA